MGMYVILFHCHVYTLKAVFLQHWVIRMPTFVKMDSKPFHPDTYIGPEHDEDDGHHNESIREKSMSIKLKVENTVRWRWTKDEFGQDASSPLKSRKPLIPDLTTEKTIKQSRDPLV
jgi:hypothetical protein